MTGSGVKAKGVLETALKPFAGQQIPAIAFRLFENTKNELI